VRWILRHKIVVGVVVLAFAAAGGGAFAATQSSSNPQAAFLSDVAKRLNVSPQRLTSALKAAMIDRLNAAVKAGRLSPTQADAIKQRIEHGVAPPFFFGPGPGGFDHPPGFFFHGPPPFGPLAAAANYLGLSGSQLFDELRAGRSLAQIARSRGKSVAGLEQAMTAAVKSRLDQAVKAGRLSTSQEQQILSTVSSRLRDFINRSGPVQFSGPPWRHPVAPGPLPTPGF
jgi:hypothetical protein